MSSTTVIVEPELRELTVHDGGASQSWLAHIESRRRTILFAALVGALAGELAAVVLPPTYEATCKMFVIPADDPTAIHGTNAFDVANATLPLVVALLRSRRLADDTVDQLKLDAAWRLSKHKASRRLFDTLTVATDRKTNLVTVSFEDRDPGRALAVVSTVARQTTAVSTSLWSERDREHRRRLEDDLATVTRQLGAAEDELKRYRERTNVIDLPSQIEATVEEAAALERVRIEKSLGVRFARAFGREQAYEVQKSARERSGAAAELAGLRHGNGSAGPLLPLDALPEIVMEHARLKRAVDELAARRELLTSRVSQLLAAEARPGGGAAMIDPPTLPTRPSGPSGLKLGGAGAVAGAFIAALVVLLLRRRLRVTGQSLVEPSA
jgi:uncharacterized protein involved in exopolysaccharide biosynthesis